MFFGITGIFFCVQAVTWALMLKLGLIQIYTQTLTGYMYQFCLSETLESPLHKATKEATGNQII